MSHPALSHTNTGDHGSLPSRYGHSNTGNLSLWCWGHDNADGHLRQRTLHQPHKLTSSSRGTRGCVSPHSHMLDTSSSSSFRVGGGLNGFRTLTTHDRIVTPAAQLHMQDTRMPVEFVRFLVTHPTLRRGRYHVHLRNTRESLLLFLEFRHVSIYCEYETGRASRSSKEP